MEHVLQGYIARGASQAALDDLNAVAARSRAESPRCDLRPCRPV